MEFGEDINIAGNKIINLPKGTKDGDSIEFSQLYSVASRLENTITANSTFSIPDVLNVYYKASLLNFEANNPYFINGKIRNIKYLLNLSADEISEDDIKKALEITNEELINNSGSATINFKITCGTHVEKLSPILISSGDITDNSFLIELSQTPRNVSDQNLSFKIDYYTSEGTNSFSNLRKSVSIKSWDKTISNNIILEVQATKGERKYNFELQQLIDTIL